MKDNSIQVQVENAKVCLVLNGRRLMTFGWRAGDDICKALDRQLRGALLETGVMRLGGGVTVSFRTEGETVLWINNGALAFSAIKSDMRKIYSAVLHGVRKAEEFDKAEKIILDNAIMFRSGAPLGLSDHPLIKAETIKEAVSNRDLRRFMPGGIKSNELLPVPRLIHGTIPATERARRLNTNEKRLLLQQLKG